ncbi:Arm DNA-binding domain-containing protein [Acidithiobacillus sp.]|uniref:Arm DNA-binding domain-containing protein n=1 Tax=Acidithiobacillus sp. TaxID=1872118 RepID=UPI003CFCA572
MRFNERWVERLKSTGKRETFWDDQPYGGGSFGLRLNPSGSKTWVFKRYDKDTKKQLWVTLGAYPQISLEEARDLARRQENPAGDETSEEANGYPIPTVRELGTLYLEKWAKVRKRSWKEDLRILGNLLCLGTNPADWYPSADPRSEVGKIVESLRTRS